MSHIVKSADAFRGDRGEHLLAATDKLQVRVWENEPGGETNPPHSNEYDYVAYVIAGSLRVRIGDEPEADVLAGDTYAVPAGVEYSFDVTETAKVVEAVAPGTAL